MQTTKGIRVIFEKSSKNESNKSNKINCRCSLPTIDQNKVQGLDTSEKISTASRLDLILSFGLEAVFDLVAVKDKYHLKCNFKQQFSKTRLLDNAEIYVDSVQ